MSKSYIHYSLVRLLKKEVGNAPLPFISIPFSPALSPLSSSPLSCHEVVHENQLARLGSEENFHEFFAMKYFMKYF